MLLILYDAVDVSSIFWARGIGEIDVSMHRCLPMLICTKAVTLRMQNRLVVVRWIGSCEGVMAVGLIEILCL